MAPRRRRWHAPTMQGAASALQAFEQKLSSGRNSRCGSQRQAAVRTGSRRHSVLAAAIDLRGKREMTVEAVIWDFGGVLTTSPFEAFARYETERGLPADIIRRTNAANHLENAWAKFERGEIGLEEFDQLFAEETRALGAEVRGSDVLPL